MKKIMFYGTTLAFNLLATTVHANSPTTDSRMVNSDEPMVAACSAAVTEKLKAAYGAKSSLLVDSDNLQGYFVSNGGTEGLRGFGTVKNDSAGAMPRVSFNCVVDLNTNKATDAIYAVEEETTPATRVVNSDEPIVSICSSAVTVKLKKAYGAQASLVMDSGNLEGYFVSNHGVEGLRGNGNVKNDKAGLMPPVAFDCVVDLNKKRATQANYTAAVN